MKKNCVALFMVAVMALSVYAAAGITTAPKAQAVLIPTLTTLSSPAFAKLGQQITLTGTVKTPTGSSVGSSGQSLALYRWDPVQGWIIQTRTSVTSGTFAATLPSPGVGTLYYQARYSGLDATWGPSTSPTRSTTVKYATQLSITASRSGGSNTVYGNMWAVIVFPTGTPRGAVLYAYQPVYVYKFNAQQTGNRWVLLTSTTTDAHGRWQVNDQTPYRTNYYAHAPETNMHFDSRTDVTPGV